MSEVKKPPKADTRTLIWGALEDLRAQGQIATRQVVAQVTGLKLVTVDDHLSRMVEDGQLRRPVAGVVEIVGHLPPPRAVSMTHSPDGPSKLEIGDVCIDIWPQERRMLANLLLGDAVQYSNIQTGQDLNLLAHQVWGELKQLKRDLGLISLEVRWISRENVWMNIHRKLLVLGLNELLAREALSLDPQVPVTAGHLFATLAGHPSVIVWHEINCEELSLAVWWKYDHSKHPQANLEGNQRESFSGAAPLAKPQHYSKFVGAVAACWVERRTGRYLQGSGARGLYEVYTRRGEADELKAIPKPIPQGFEVEGKFFL